MRIKIEDHGSVVLFVPIDDDASAWLRENVQAEPWQWLGKSLAVEHRAARDLTEAIRSAS